MFTIAPHSVQQLAMKGKCTLRPSQDEIEYLVSADLSDTKLNRNTDCSDCSGG